MSRRPDEEPPHPELPRFEHLPVLTAYTVRNGEGTHVIDDYTDRFGARLGRSRSALVGRPLERLYDAGDVPEPSGTGDGHREPVSDGGDSVSTGGSTSGFGLPEVATDVDASAVEQSAAVERDLVAADGHLVHTLAESVPREDCDGYAVVHVDATRRERREEQVGALNRLLRHNVRNDLNLLRGYAGTLRDHDDESVAEAAAVIDRIADRWLGLAETGREIEQLSANTSPETVAIGDLLSTARTTVEREYPAGRIDVEFDGVRPDREVSEQWYAAVAELCENGVKHAGSDRADADAVVSVTVGPADRPGWVVVAVADEGPGIPLEERATLRGDAETPLRHASGLGMWLVRFVVEQFDGRVAVRDRDPTGSVVELTVPTVSRE